MENLIKSKTKLENRINQLLSQKSKGKEISKLEDQLYLTDCDIKRRLKVGG